MSEFSNSLWSGSCNSEDEPQFFDLSVLSSPDSFPGKKSRSTSPKLQLDPNKRPPYSFNAIIAMAFQNSPQKRMKLQEIYEYISTSFPYYSAEKSSGWESSVRHNLSVHSHFQKVKSEDGTGNYWEMTCDLGTDVFIGEKCGKLHRTGRFCCSNITQSKDESLIFDSSHGSDSSTGQESCSTSPEQSIKENETPGDLRLHLHQLPVLQNKEIIRMAEFCSPKFVVPHSFSEGQSGRWTRKLLGMTCDFETDVYIGEKSGNLRRRENSKEKPSAPPPVPMDLPNIPLMPNPLFYNPTTMMLQNQILIQMVFQNYQLQQSIQGVPAIGTLSVLPFLMNEVPKKEK
ncbi:unnamed protein product [Caenorhabditis brenneri]